MDIRHTKKAATAQGRDTLGPAQVEGVKRTSPGSLSSDREMHEVGNQAHASSAASGRKTEKKLEVQHLQTTYLEEVMTPSPQVSTGSGSLWWDKESDPFARSGTTPRSPTGQKKQEDDQHQTKEKTKQQSETELGNKSLEHSSKSDRTRKNSLEAIEKQLLQIETEKKRKAETEPETTAEGHKKKLNPVAVELAETLKQIEKYIRYLDKQCESSNNTKREIKEVTIKLKRQMEK
ncbi:hypothetical protein FQR65_LT18383 [Abscondita terminalis]|nr:hypothetical protein FQR65_LT18383 [Abscondita terminalis]